MTGTPKAPAHVGQIIQWDPVLADITLTQPERRGFTVNDQLERLLEASDLTSEFGVMHQVLALCALPRTDPGEERQYRRNNGWWTLYMTATGVPGLPYGSYPRLLLAWVSTEAVRTRSPVLDLGDSLAGFMRTLGVHSTGAGPRGIRTRLRDQMYRLFNTSIRLDTRQRDGDNHGHSSVSSQVASHTEFWWELDDTGKEQIDQGKIRLAHDLFENLLAHPVPVDLRTLRALRRSSLGIDLYLWLNYVAFKLHGPKDVTWPQLYRQFGSHPLPQFDRRAIQNFRKNALRELKKIQVAWPELRVKVILGRAGTHGRGKAGGLRIYPSPTKIQPRSRAR